MNYGSVTSGIEAATEAWHPLGWHPMWFSEIDPYCCRLLKHKYPHVPNLGDMLLITENRIFRESIIDLLVGGTPCQSFSLAGIRTGLADLRGNLSLQYCRILTIKRPRWFVWENVPGVLTSFSNEETDTSGGGGVWETADFATLLTAFRDCGYSVAWRVLDSQYFGVAQRRRRVFVVGHIGTDWRPSAAVLFDPQSSSGNSQAKSDKGDKAAGASAPDFTQDSRGCWWDGGQISQTLDAVLAKGQAMPEKNRFPYVITSQGLRKLTPYESEILQGFSGTHTNIPGAKDTPRYEAIGNSMTTHVMHWIGRRIELVDKILQ